MSRKYPVIDGEWYHMYNRGANKAEIFKDDQDYIYFISKLKQYKEEFNVEILAYSIMPNHYHILVYGNELNETQKIQPKIIGSSDDIINLRSFMHRLQTSYTMYFNKKYKHSGVIYQGPFKSKLVETDRYLLQLVDYINLQSEHHQINDDKLFFKDTLDNKFHKYSSLYEFYNYNNLQSKIINLKKDILDYDNYNLNKICFDELNNEEFKSDFQAQPTKTKYML